MSAAERIAGDILLGAEFIKYGKDSDQPAKVTLEEALQDIVIEWNN